MKSRILLLTGLLTATIGASAMAGSNAAIQSGKLSLEGTAYSSGDIGIGFEYGINPKIALYGGSNELVPALGLKFALGDTSALSDAALKVGIINSGISLGLDFHYKLNNTARFFADGSINSLGRGFYTNAAAGLAFNVSKQAAVTAQVRSIAGYGTVGIGARFTF